MAKTHSKAPAKSVEKNAKNGKVSGMSKINEEDENKAADDEEMNSGFGGYLRSGEGVEMMKLFVIANTMLVLMTVVWPKLKESLYIIRDYFMDE